VDCAACRYSGRISGATRSRRPVAYRFVYIRNPRPGHALTGPHPWAEALRRRTRTVSIARSVAAAVGRAVTSRPDDATVAWVVGHREVLQLGGVVGIVLLLVVDLSWLGPLLLVLVIGGFELIVARLAGLTPSEPDPRGAVQPPRPA
jgi:hypothetical protein